MFFSFIFGKSSFVEENNSFSTGITKMPTHSSTTKERLDKLIEAKNKLERKINANGEILAANGNIGMEAPLIDAEGYPRSDIDVFQVRHARHEIICLQNDHKDLMSEIERLLHQYHTENGLPDPNITNGIANIQLNTQSAEVTPIVMVNLVSPGSPAEEAGLREGDEIIEFGSINSSNFNKDLYKIAALVENMRNQHVTLKVKRRNGQTWQGQNIEMTLIPHAWSGRGLLGCNIVLAP